MKLIVGLGNPGKEYVATRHNVGYFFVEKIVAGDLAGFSGSNFVTELSSFTIDKKNKAEIAKGTINKRRVVLAKSLTYMNDSGHAVQALLHFFKLTPADLLVIHDDKDIPLGEIRVQRDRGAAGHNGVSSIMEQLGTKNFLRLRVGIQPIETAAKNNLNITNLVLGKFSAAEKKILQSVTDKIFEEIKKFVA